ncbi:MAG: AzlC family ABC transporter permease [Pseudomonadota bacterium]
MLAPNPTQTRSFLTGVLNALPMQIATVPFGVIFGALAIEAGLSLTETMAMTSIVVAGAAQLVALQMLVDQAPVWLIVFTAAFVNLRMAIYSAAMAVYWRDAGTWPRVLAAWFLNDQSYALSIRRYADVQEPEQNRVAFFFGVGVCCLTCWILACLVGVAIGNRIPADWPVDFAVALVFVALTAPWLRNWPNLIVAVTAGAVSVALADWASGAGVVVAISLAIAVGMLIRGKET